MSGLVARCRHGSATSRALGLEKRLGSVDGFGDVKRLMFELALRSLYSNAESRGVGYAAGSPSGPDSVYSTTASVLVATAKMRCPSCVPHTHGIRHLRSPCLY